MNVDFCVIACYALDTSKASYRVKGLKRIRFICVLITKCSRLVLEEHNVHSFHLSKYAAMKER